MKNLLFTLFLACTLFFSHGQGQPFSIGSPKTPDNSNTINLGRKPDGYWYEKGNTGPEIPFKVDPQANNLTVFQSLSSVRGGHLAVRIPQKLSRLPMRM
ncbi:hypothetical protein GO730_05075 [Spirosoma sp. HMF3257]|uniref:Uncharacterized protein n=1 Tax=Spirosoma telluris TaxID=2183553 RepID=A0A327NF21_9BACT|nr:hypothetical protein [Spirosoma telluris]RAI73901.1 hypothetical protein HMF3257_05040 [Spirosoma telluris]